MKEKQQLNQEPIDCQSEEGITIGLIDSLMTIAEVLNKRLTPQNAEEALLMKEFSTPIKEALKDYYDNRALKSITVKAVRANGIKIEI